MRVRIRQHVNPLGLVFEEFRGQVPDLAQARGRELELEIGCAEAQFLFERAERDPSRLYLGMEIRDQLVDWVNQEAEARALPVHAIFCNANLHLSRLFPPSSVTRVFLNFPDPWFKKRHHKRRMIDDDLLRDIHAIMVPRGEIFFQSDIWDLALDTMDRFERLDDLYQSRAGSWSFWRSGNPYGARSWREAHCEESGLPIWRLWYTRL